MSPRAQHAGALVFALSVTMLVMVIGVAGVVSLRAATAQSVRTDDTISATYLARSAAVLGVQLLTEQSAWRSTISNDAWYGLGTVNGAKLYMKAVDDDGDLADDESDSVRIYGRAATRDATRMISALARPETVTGSNVLSNGGFESGTSGWIFANGTPVLDTSAPPEGLQSLCLTDRPALSMAQAVADVSSVVENNTEYELELWVRFASGTGSVDVSFQLAGSSPAWTQYQSIPDVGTTWARYTLTFPSTGSSSFTSAWITIAASSGTADFCLDGIVLREAPTSRLVLAAGSWRREID